LKAKGEAMKAQIIKPGAKFKYAGKVCIIDSIDYALPRDVYRKDAITAHFENDENFKFNFPLNSSYLKNILEEPKEVVLL
jgi:hypothetical protein